MYVTSYRFPAEQGNERAVAYSAGMLLVEFLWNGQIVRPWHMAISQGYLLANCLIPEERSLDPQFWSPEAIAALEEFRSASTGDPSSTIIGPLEQEESRPCTCASPSAFVLYTFMLRIAPPVVCYDCSGHVPLYRLPYPTELTGYGDILRWESMYKACDQLYMESGVGERFGRTQISSVDSPLTKRGRELCRSLERAAGKPFYYHITSASDRSLERCPSCGSDWEYADHFAALIDRRCATCKLAG